MTKDIVALPQDGVGFDGRGAVRGFGEDAATNLADVLPGDLAFQRGRDEHFAFELQQFLVGDVVAVR